MTLPSHQRSAIAPRPSRPWPTQRSCHSLPALLLAGCLLCACDDKDSGEGGEDTAALCLFSPDADGDGYGDESQAIQAECGSSVSGYVSDSSDCDDADQAVNPGAAEVCNQVDDDCDGLLDEDDPDAQGLSVWYADDDGDGYGDASDSAEVCEQPEGHIADDSDCDDQDAAINPQADEVCDEIDNDCDGATDEDDALDASTWYQDSDGDGYGDADATGQACQQPTGFVEDSSDCDDAVSYSHPDAAEVSGDGLDNDCDGTTDETTEVTYWLDDAEADQGADNDLGCADGTHDFAACRAVFHDGANSLAWSATQADAADGARSLVLDYQVASDYVAAIWLMPGDQDYALDDDFVGMEQLCLWLRDPGASADYDVPVEFSDANGNSSSSASVSVSSSWQQQCVDLSTASADGVDFDHLAQLALLLRSDQVPATSGSLCVDEVAFVDTDFPDFTGLSTPGDYSLFIDLQVARGARFFLDRAHGASGLMQDKATTAEKSSIAAVGFGLATLTAAVDRGLADESEAQALIETALASLLDNKGSLSVNGFYHHFLDISGATPAAFVDSLGAVSEISNIDTALLATGALVAGQRFGGDIESYAESLYWAMQWNWFVNTSYASYDPDDEYQFHLAYKPDYEAGYELPDESTGGWFAGVADGQGDYDPYTWAYHSDEVTLMSILGVQTPEDTLHECVLWEVIRNPSDSNGDLAAKNWYGSAYAEVLADLFWDFEAMGSEADYHLDCEVVKMVGMDHFANARAFFDEMEADSLSNAAAYPALEVLPHGLSAALGMDPDQGATGYGVYGAWGAQACADDPTVVPAGNVSPAAEAMATLFYDSDPDLNEPLQNLVNLYLEHPHAWGIYGFRDGLNLGTPSESGQWFAHDYFGINVGPLVLALDAFDPQNPGQVREYLSDAIGAITWW